MTAFSGQGAPVPGSRGQDGDKYAHWDAAYVLGSLSEMDRREFEAHLEECRTCWDAVTELAGHARPAVAARPRRHCRRR